MVAATLHMNGRQDRDGPLEVPNAFSRIGRHDVVLKQKPTNVVAVKELP